MEQRKFGRADLEVSAIGFGGWAIGGDAWGEVDDRASLAAIRRAIDTGVTLIDTADVYGDGRSERLVGQAVRDSREQLVLSTKGGLMGHHRDRTMPPVYDTAEKVVDACESSLRRLGTDMIDVYWCHIWWDDPAETEAFIEGFGRLKAAGKIRYAGVSTDDIAHLRHYGDTGAIDGVQLDYSILNRAAESEMLPYARERGLGVFVRGPLAKGLLTGKFDRSSTFPAGDIRESWPGSPEYKRNLDVVAQLGDVCQPGETLGELALRFVLSNPAVTAAIPGAKSADQVDANVAAGAGPPLSRDALARIDALVASSATP